MSAAAAAPTVEKSAPELVPPAGPTPGGTLPLSSIDKTAAVRVPVVLVQVFPRAASDVGGGQQDAAVAAMRDGFARALVPYYPVAGRIADVSPGDGEPVVDCTGQGVWFVEAAASCALADVNYLERPLLIPKKDLLPKEELEDLIIMAQVRSIRSIAADQSINHLVRPNNLS